MKLLVVFDLSVFLIGRRRPAVNGLMREREGQRNKEVSEKQGAMERQEKRIR